MPLAYWFAVSLRCRAGDSFLQLCKVTTRGHWTSFPQTENNPWPTKHANPFQACHSEPSSMIGCARTRKILRDPSRSVVETGYTWMNCDRYTLSVSHFKDVQGLFAVSTVFSCSHFGFQAVLTVLCSRDPKWVLLLQCLMKWTVHQIWFQAAWPSMLEEAAGSDRSRISLTLFSVILRSVNLDLFAVLWALSENLREKELPGCCRYMY